MHFQLRHKKYGLFQGEFIGFLFWHPCSNSSEQGIYKFNSWNDIGNFINKLSNIDNISYNSRNFIIEPFDRGLDRKLVRDGHGRLGIEIPNKYL